MINLIVQAIIVGLITLLIGNIILNLSINKVNKEDIKQYKIKYSFFITGFILHLGLEVFGFNRWYCNKESITKICRLSELGNNEWECKNQNITKICRVSELGNTTCTIFT